MRTHGVKMNATRRTAVRGLGLVLVILGGLGAALLAGTGATAAPGPSPMAEAKAVAPVRAAESARQAPVASAAQASRRSFPYPTTSSPITISRDGRYVWTVNPGADTVSVIRTSNNQVVRTVGVGDEPQSVALDPNNRYAFVANAAGNSVTVIRIRNASSGSAARPARAEPHHRSRAVERRRLARRPPRLRGQQRARTRSPSSTRRARGSSATSICSAAVAATRTPTSTSSPAAWPSRATATACT